MSVDIEVLLYILMRNLNEEIVY